MLLSETPFPISKFLIRFDFYIIIIIYNLLVWFLYYNNYIIFNYRVNGTVKKKKRKRERKWDPADNLLIEEMRVALHIDPKAVISWRNLAQDLVCHLVEGWPDELFPRENLAKLPPKKVETNPSFFIYFHLIFASINWSCRCLHQ